MGLFGKRKKKREDEAPEFDAPTYYTEDEMNFKLEHGAEALFDQPPIDFPNIVDINRPSKFIN